MSEVPSAVFGGHSMILPLKQVLVRKPDMALHRANPQLWHYTSSVNLQLAIQQHDDFVHILQNQGVQVTYHEQKSEHHADAIFVHDPALLTNYGTIILRMGKELRCGEEELIKQTFIELGIPILHELSAPALAEGGDLLWLDEKTLLAGKGFRTNSLGIAQLRDVLAPFGVTVVDFDLAYCQGKDACLHLQSFISLVDVKIALIYSPLMPVALYQLLQERSFTLIEVPEEEFATMGANTLALKPGLVLMLEENIHTRKRLEEAGIKVLTYCGTELSLKTEGGPTCLTRPLLRIDGTE